MSGLRQKTAQKPPAPHSPAPRGLALDEQASGAQALGRAAWIMICPVICLVSRQAIYPHLCATLAVLALVLLPSAALAQEAAQAGGTVDAMIEAMRDTLTTLGETAGQAARNLLLIFFGMDLVLRFGRWAIQGSSFDEVWGTWFYQLTFVCIVYALVLMVHGHSIGQDAPYPWICSRHTNKPGTPELCHLVENLDADTDLCFLVIEAACFQFCTDDTLPSQGNRLNVTVG